jgi:hypothetical protein
MNRFQICFNFAFKFNLRRYAEVTARLAAAQAAADAGAREAGAYTRPLFSST